MRAHSTCAVAMTATGFIPIDVPHLTYVRICVSSFRLAETNRFQNDRILVLKECRTLRIHSHDIQQRCAHNPICKQKHLGIVARAHSKTNPISSTVKCARRRGQENQLLVVSKMSRQYPQEKLRKEKENRVKAFVHYVRV